MLALLLRTEVDECPPCGAGSPSCDGRAQATRTLCPCAPMARQSARGANRHRRLRATPAASQPHRYASPRRSRAYLCTLRAAAPEASCEEEALRAIVVAARHRQHAHERRSHTLVSNSFRARDAALLRVGILTRKLAKALRRPPTVLSWTHEISEHADKIRRMMRVGLGRLVLACLATAAKAALLQLPISRAAARTQVHLRSPAIIAQQTNLPPGWYTHLSIHKAAARTTVISSSLRQLEPPQMQQAGAQQNLPLGWYTTVDPQSGQTYYCNQQLASASLIRHRCSRVCRICHLAGTRLIHKVGRRTTATRLASANLIRQWLTDVTVQPP